MLVLLYSLPHSLYHSRIAHSLSPSLTPSLTHSSLSYRSFVRYERVQAFIKQGMGAVQALQAAKAKGSSMHVNDEDNDDDNGDDDGGIVY